MPKAAQSRKSFMLTDNGAANQKQVSEQSQAADGSIELVVTRWE